MISTHPYKVIASIPVRLLAAVGIFMAAGCTSVTTRTYFAAADVDTDKPVVTLYRVTVTAKSTNAKSSVTNGFYSADALRAFSGEAPKAGAADTGPRPTTIGYYELEKGPSGWKSRPPDTVYTMVYGPDSSAIGAVIGNYMKSDKLGHQLAALLAKASNGEAANSASQMAAQKNQFEQARDRLSSRIELIADKIDAETEPSPQELSLHLIAAAQAIANSLGATDAFVGATADDAMKMANDFWKNAKSAAP